MFSRFETALKLAALCLILGLCGWTWYQSQKISSLKAENQAQAQTIQQQEDANKALNIALQQERDAVIEQQQRNDEIKQATQDKVQVVRKIIKSQPCYNTRIYDDAIERLH